MKPSDALFGFQDCKSFYLIIFRCHIESQKASKTKTKHTLFIYFTVS